MVEKYIWSLKCYEFKVMNELKIPVIKFGRSISTSFYTSVCIKAVRFHIAIYWIRQIVFQNIQMVVPFKTWKQIMQMFLHT